MRRRHKQRLKRWLAIALALALPAALAFFLPYLWGLYSGDDVPPEGIGRPFAAVTRGLTTLELPLRANGVGLRPRRLYNGA